MKLYSIKQFIKDGYTIPNIENHELGYTITETETLDSYGRQRKRWTLLLNGILVAVFSNPWTSHIEVYDMNHDLASAELGYDSMEISRGRALILILDNIYYEVNPPKLINKSGKVFKKTYTALTARSYWNRDSRKTKLTDRILNVVNTAIDYDIIRDWPQININSPEFFEIKSGKIPRGCALSRASNKLINSWETVRTATSSNFVVGSDESPEDYGYYYIAVEYKQYWLKPDEYVHNDTIFNRNEHTATCSQCNNLCPESFIDVEENICLTCLKERYKIHNYSVRAPELLKFKAKKANLDTLYLGCELEYETTNRDVARVKVSKAMKGHAILKSDGSIRNGFEIVTCPATLDIHLEEFKKFFDPLPVELLNDSNVGMHVHVSRAPLSVLTVGKLTEFMNKEENRPFITHIAGRSLNGFCNQNSNRTISFPLTSRSGERYNTLNLCNKDTIEFRIFSTPLTYADFASKIQFCQALVDYSKPCKQAVALKIQTTYSNFIEWLTPQRKAYPELIAKIKSFSLN